MALLLGTARLVFGEDWAAWTGTPTRPAPGRIVWCASGTGAASSWGWSR